MSELIASAYIATGQRYTNSSSHPAISFARTKSSNWALTNKGKQTPHAKLEMRKFYKVKYLKSFRYTGKPNFELAKKWGLIK